MATAFTHGMVGLVAGRIFFRRPMPARFWVLAAGCSALPDLDVGLHVYGVEYGDLWGHRGMMHSLLFAAALDHLGAGRRPVLEPPLEAGALAPLREEPELESVREHRERRVEGTRHHLPMTRRRVLAGRPLGHATKGAARRRATQGVHALDCTESGRNQMGCIQAAGRGDEVIERVRS